MNKSGILKKSIEKIRSLEAENSELKLENRRLREMIQVHLSSKGTNTPLPSPPISQSGSPIPDSPGSSGDISLDSDQKTVYIQRGLSPHSKFALCMFMFAVVAVNNFGIFLNEASPMDFIQHSDAPSARRTILSAVMDDVS